jgi:nucleoside-diphosphate-sugar epimerase
VPLTPKHVRTMAADMCFDVSKAEDELGWQSRGTFREHAEEVINWYRSEGLLPA